MRIAREATYKFMNATAGNEAGFEEAARALFAGNLSTLHSSIEKWPNDIREHIVRLAEASVPKVNET